jgi:hypothetical protein
MLINAYIKKQVRDIPNFNWRFLFDMFWRKENKKYIRGDLRLLEIPEIFNNFSFLPGASVNWKTVGSVSRNYLNFRLLGTPDGFLFIAGVLNKLSAKRFLRKLIIGKVHKSIHRKRAINWLIKEIIYSNRIFEPKIKSNKFIKNISTHFFNKYFITRINKIKIKLSGINIVDNYIIKNNMALKIPVLKYSKYIRTVISILKKKKKKYRAWVTKDSNLNYIKYLRNNSYFRTYETSSRLYSPRLDHREDRFIFFKKRLFLNRLIANNPFKFNKIFFKKFLYFFFLKFRIKSLYSNKILKVNKPPTITIIRQKLEKTKKPKNKTLFFKLKTLYVVSKVIYWKKLQSLFNILDMTKYKIQVKYWQLQYKKISNLHLYNNFIFNFLRLTTRNKFTKKISNPDVRPSKFLNNSVKRNVFLTWLLNLITYWLKLYYFRNLWYKNLFQTSIKNFYEKILTLPINPKYSSFNLFSVTDFLDTFYRYYYRHKLFYYNFKANILPKNFLLKIRNISKKHKYVFLPLLVLMSNYRPGINPIKMSQLFFKFWKSKFLFYSRVTRFAHKALEYKFRSRILPVKHNRQYKIRKHRRLNKPVRFNSKYTLANKRSYFFTPSIIFNLLPYSLLKRVSQLKFQNIILYKIMINKKIRKLFIISNINRAWLTKKKMLAQDRLDILHKYKKLNSLKKLTKLEHKKNNNEYKLQNNVNFLNFNKIVKLLNSELKQTCFLDQEKLLIAKKKTYYKMQNELISILKKKKIYSFELKKKNNNNFIIFNYLIPVIKFYTTFRKHITLLMFMLNKSVPFNYNFPNKRNKYYQQILNYIDQLAYNLINHILHNPQHPHFSSVSIFYYKILWLRRLLLIDSNLNKVKIQIYNRDKYFSINDYKCWITVENKIMQRKRISILKKKKIQLEKKLKPLSLLIRKYIRISHTINIIRRIYTRTTRSYRNNLYLYKLKKLKYTFGRIFLSKYRPKKKKQLKYYKLRLYFLLKKKKNIYTYLLTLLPNMPICLNWYHLISAYHKYRHTALKKSYNRYNKFIYYSTFNRSRNPVSRLKLVIFASKRNYVNFKKLKSWAENNRKIWNFVAKMKFRTKQKGRNLYVNSLNRFNNFCYMLGELFDEPESKPPLQYSRFGIQLPDRKKLGRRSYYYFSTTKHFNFSKWVNRKKTFFLPRISSKKIFFRLLTIFKQFFYKQDKELVRDKNDDIIDTTRYLLGNNFFFNNKINKIVSPSRLNPLLWKLYKKIAFSRLIWSKSTKFFMKKWFSQRVEKVIEKSKEKPEKLITTFQTIRYKHVHLRFGLRKFGKVKIPRKRRTKFSGKWQRVSYHLRRFVWHRWSRIVSLFLFRAFDYSSKIAKKYQTSTKKSISKYSLFKACCRSLKELTSQKLYLLKKRTKVLDTVFAAWIHNSLKNTRINNIKTLINLIFNNISKLHNLNSNIAFFYKELLYKNLININKNNLLYPLKKTIKYKNYFNYEMPIKVTIIKNLLKIFLNHIRVLKEPITFKMIKDLTIDTALPTFASKAIKLFLKQHPEYIANRKKRIELHFGKLSFFNYIIQSILFNIYDWATSKDDIKLKL